MLKDVRKDNLDFPMKLKSRCGLALLLILSVSLLSAFTLGGRKAIILQSYPGCVARNDALELTRSVLQQDGLSQQKLLSTCKCIWLDAGQEVSIEDVSPDGEYVKIRLPGDITAYWINKKLLAAPENS